MTDDVKPRPTDVGREELATTRFEKFLAVVLAVFFLIGLLWLYAQPLDRTDDQRYDSTYDYSYVHEPRAAPPIGALPSTEAKPPPGTAVLEEGPVGDPRPGDEELLRQLKDASSALSLAQDEVTTRKGDVETTREAYRTRLDAGEPAEDYKKTFLEAEQALDDAEAKLSAAQAAFDKVDLAGQQAQQRLAKASDELREKLQRDTFLLRLALTLTSLALSVLMLHQLHRRRPRYTLIGMSAVAAATALAIIMTGDYIDIEEAGPVVLSLAGTALTLTAFVAYQRWLARRLPERRVRKGECPFCGYPARDDSQLPHEHCQGCGRSTVGACTACEMPRRVGARYCGACGAG